MTSILLTIIALLVILLTALLILFYRQENRLWEEITNVKKSEVIESSYLSSVGMSFLESLRAIIQDCDLLFQKQSIKSNPEDYSIVNDVSNKSRQLLQYTNELLDMSGTESSSPSSSRIEVNLIELVLSYRREILHYVKDGVSVNVRTELSPHTKVKINTIMFRQLIMHLLRVAATNTDKGYITIRYAAEKDGLRFWIENTIDGPAVPDLLQDMFSGQIEPNGKHLYKGKDMVLSLSVSKTIVKDFNGTICAESRQNGQENLLVITFWLPCQVKAN